MGGYDKQRCYRKGGWWRKSVGGYDKQICCRKGGWWRSQWVGMINRDVVEMEGGGEVSGRV